MPARPAHTVKRILRHFVAAGMTLLYLAVIFSPLASYAIHGTKPAAMGIRQCSGDCDTCGCSAESRAANTCCCAKKRLQEAHAHQDDDRDTPDCCKKEHGNTKETVIACGCPCGSKEQPALSTGTSSEVLPFRYATRIILTHSDTIYSTPMHRLTSCHGDPPEPPPKLV